MRIVDPQRFPHRVKEDAQLRIPLADGTWLPDASGDRRPPTLGPCPPSWSSSRTASVTSPRSETRSTTPTWLDTDTPIRVDLRGSGDSEGILTDEYLEQELRDAEQVLAWLAAQPWCNGRTGMMGISWGDSTLFRWPHADPRAARRRHRLLHRRSVRRRRPLHGRLSADRQPVVGFDDVRLQLLPSGSRGRRALAGDVAPTVGRQRALVGGVATPSASRRLLAARLDLRGLLRHHPPRARRQRLGRRLHKLGVPLLAALDVPRKGLDGPWSHKYPHLGQPGPAVGFLQELIRWWDHWLRDATTTSWPSRCCASGCRRVSRRRRPTRSGRSLGR